MLAQERSTTVVTPRFLTAGIFDLVVDISVYGVSKHEFSKETRQYVVNSDHHEREREVYVHVYLFSALSVVGCIASFAEMVMGRSNTINLTSKSYIRCINLSRGNLSASPVLI